MTSTLTGRIQPVCSDQWEPHVSPEGRSSADLLRPASSHHHGHCQFSCSALALNSHSGQTIISDDHLSSGLRRCSNAPFVSPILVLLRSCWEQAHIGSWHRLNLSPSDVRACTQPPSKKSILNCCCVPTWRHLQISEFFLQRLFGFILNSFGEVSVRLSQSFLSAFIALLLYCQIQPDCVTQLGYFKIVGRQSKVKVKVVWINSPSRRSSPT